MFIPIADARIFATSFGRPGSRAILGVGGWTGSWELWIEPFSILSRAWHTIAYDHRGAGATLAPVESIVLERLVDDVFAVLDAHGVERCVLAAESAGALTALSAALKHPQRISGLVIVDGLWHAPPLRDDDRFAAGLRSDYVATIGGFVDACLPEPDSEPARRWGRQILQRATPESAVALLRVNGSVDLRADLNRVTQPALVIHGDRDAIVPPEAGRELAKALPNAKLVIVEGAGHVPTITRAAEVARAIDDFFGRPGDGA